MAKKQVKGTEQGLSPKDDTAPAMILTSEQDHRRLQGMARLFGRDSTTVNSGGW